MSAAAGAPAPPAPPRAPRTTALAAGAPPEARGAPTSVALPPCSPRTAAGRPDLGATGCGRSALRSGPKLAIDRRTAILTTGAAGSRFAVGRFCFSSSHPPRPPPASAARWAMGGARRSALPQLAGSVLRTGLSGAALSAVCHAHTRVGRTQAVDRWDAGCFWGVV